MKTSLRKILLSFVLLVLIASAIPAAVLAVDMPYVIYETSHSRYIGSGIKYENIKKFTSQGWWNINLIRVDLTNEYAEIKGLFSDKGLSNRQAVSDLVTRSNAVAGINGDFFNYNPIPHPMGTFIENGEIISSPIERAYALPTFYLDIYNNADIAFFDRSMKITSLESGKSVNISLINKTADMNMVTLLNKNWGSKSFGNKYNDPTHGEMVEMVVVDDVVKEIRIGKEAVSIPENGYVICVRGSRKEPLLENFKVGDRVKLELGTTPNLENIKFAIGGGSIILKDGKVTNTNINIAGNQPRTGIGISKDGKELILATIDGRDISYVGVTQEVFGEILKSLGAYNAINLDGGGSTTMAIRPLDKQLSEVVNKPSEGTERKVVNGVGVFTNAPKGELSYIEIETDESNMFPNTTRKFTVKGYDQHHNPIDIDESKVELTAIGIKGEINGNSFKALSPGKGVIQANYQGLKASIEIRVFDEVESLVLPVSKFHLHPYGKKTIGNIYGLDKNGHKAAIYNEDIEWTVSGNIGNVENGIFYSNGNMGSGAVVLKAGKAVNSILVSIGSDEGTLIEGFEDINRFNTVVYPYFVKGSIALKNEGKEGKNSLSVKYDFTEGEVSRAFYVRFLSNGKIGLPLNGTPNKLSLWVKGDGNGAWLRAKIVDAKGNSYNLSFRRFIDFKDWQQVETPIPSEVTYPITLERIYVVEIDIERKYSGEILIDGLKAHYPPKYDEKTAPKATQVVDEKNVKSVKSESGLSIVVTRLPEVSKELNESIKSAIGNKLNEMTKGYDLGLVIGKKDMEINKNIGSNNTINIGYPYISHKHKNLLIIDASSIRGGLRPTNPQQWIWLKDGLNAEDKDHIILFLNTPIFGQAGFKDPMEAELLHNTLVESYEKGKTVWVVFPGSETKVEIKDGIRYIQLNNKPVNSIEELKYMNSIEFIVNGGEITYQIH
ncbi:MAG TPA: hypothetical protein GXX53_07250 [Tissierellia bacterium]|nr:hypothetical protein [Tissierellia bacterium]